MHAQVHIPVNSVIRNYVTAIWETIPPGVSHELILPKGNVEMIFNLSQPMRGILPHKDIATPAPDCFIQGMNTHVVQVQYSGPQHLFGICLRPDMVKALLGIHPSECKNSLIDLTLIKPFFKRIWQRLNDANDFAERVSIIEKEFPMLGTNDCTRTRHFSELFSASSPSQFPSIDTLSKQLCYSSRQLNRKSQDMFGISTEELIVHTKFRSAVHLMHQQKRSLTDIAYETGFYDQAHFCRIFKQYTGFTAKRYQQQKSDLPFHIFSDVRA